MSASLAALILSGPVLAATVCELQQRMLARLQQPAPYEIRAAEVTQLDAAGAQLLYAFITETRRRGHPARWASASLYLVEAARVLGMEHCLGLAGLPPEVTSWRP